MWTSDQITARPYVQFVMGVKNAMPADCDVFNYYIHNLGASFCCPASASIRSGLRR